MADIDELSNSTNFITHDADDIIIKVVGVGGGGSNAVKHMFEQGIEQINFVVCNTDKQALDKSPVAKRLLIGRETTHGLGAGDKPEIGRQAAEESAEEIAALFDETTKMVFITAGMGGGTGTGAGPVVARLAKERGKLTIGIVTLPFLFEGERKILKAIAGAEEMGKYVDALLVINNQRLSLIYKDLNFMNAFHRADNTLSDAAGSISELITCQKAHINLDFHDVDTTLRNGGAAIISTGYGEGENRVTKAIDDALNSPLLKDSDIRSARRLLFNLYYNPEAEIPFTMGEAEELTQFTSTINRDVEVIWGMAFDETLGNKVKIAILASGFGVSVNDTLTSGRERILRPGSSDTPGKPQGAETRNDMERLKEHYGQTVVDEIRANSDRQRYYVLTAEQMEDDAVLDVIERFPAYNRDRRRMEDAIDEATHRERSEQSANRSSAQPNNPHAGTNISFS